jgi:hypothetical protein
MWLQFSFFRQLNACRGSCRGNGEFFGPRKREIDGNERYSIGKSESEKSVAVIIAIFGVIEEL